MKNENDTSSDQPDLGRVLQDLPRTVAALGTSRVRRAWDLLASGLGIGLDLPPRPGSGPIDTGTHLAMERTFWAAERTLMAWIRTTLSMISFGFTIGKIGQVLHDVDVKAFRRTHQVSVSSIADLLVILGTLSLLAAAVQYSIRANELHGQGLHRQLSIAFAVAVVLVFLGVFALSALVLEL